LPDLLEAVDDRDTGDGVDPREGLETNRGQVVLARDLAEVNDGLRRRVHAQHAVATCLVNLKKPKSICYFFSFLLLNTRWGYPCLAWVDQPAPSPVSQPALKFKRFGVQFH
jgi:hypothetical protein